MTEHLSALDLDEIAAGLAPDATRAHANGCNDCRTRLTRISADRRAAMNDPRFALGRARLHATSARHRQWGWGIGGAVAAAASIAFVLWLPHRAQLRAKGGGPTLALVSVDGQPATAPRVDDVVELRANPGSRTHGLILAISKAPPSTTVLWPAGASRSGSMTAGKYTSIRVRVTPGAVRIVGAFSDRPIGIAEVEPSSGVDIRELEVEPVP
jgi:hypothetical protein